MPSRKTLSLPQTLADFEQLAAKRLAKDYYNYVAGAAGDESDFAYCRRYLDSVRLVHRVLRGSHTVDTQCSILGSTCTHPFLIAPSAYLGSACKRGDTAMALAAREFGTVFTLSTLASEEIGAVARASKADLWQQLYIYKDREITRSLVHRCQEVGCKALVLTVDQPAVGIRYRDRKSGFTSPKDFRLPNVLSEAAMARLGNTSAAVGKFLSEQRNAMLTWKDVEWLRSISPLPILLKGILSREDARLAVQSGAAGIIVSNHGGRQLDALVSPVAVLSAIRAAVGRDTLVLVDGGIRSGTDVIRCIALGANAVLLARPLVWGLAVAGTTGALRVLNILAEELRNAMAILGVSQLSELGPQYLFSPSDQS